MALQQWLENTIRSGEFRRRAVMREWRHSTFDVKRHRRTILDQVHSPSPQPSPPEGAREPEGGGSITREPLAPTAETAVSRGVFGVETGVFGRS